MKLANLQFLRARKIQILCLRFWFPALIRRSLWLRVIEFSPILCQDSKCEEMGGERFHHFNNVDFHVEDQHACGGKDAFEEAELKTFLNGNRCKSQKV